jgi:hypothetical protein
VQFSSFDKVVEAAACTRTRLRGHRWPLIGLQLEEFQIQISEVVITQRASPFLVLMRQVDLQEADIIWAFQGVPGRDWR